MCAFVIYLTMVFLCYLLLMRGLSKMKLISILSIFLCSVVMAQTPIQSTPIGTDVNSFVNKLSADRMNFYQSTNLNNLDLTLQSKKLKGVSAQHRSISASSNLSLAQEYENKFNFGVPFTKGGTLSLNAVNQKTFGSMRDDNFFGFSFSKNTSSVNLILQVQQLNSSKIKLTGQDTTIANLKATINL